MRFILVAVFLTAFLSALIAHDVEFESSKSPPKQIGSEVIDCRNQTSKCNTSYIDKRASKCNKWREFDPYSEFNCNFTSENVGDIRLISDSANYIPGPKTDTEYEVEKFVETGTEPWDLEFLPSGSPIWTTRPGSIYRGKDSDLIGSLDVETDTMGGLLGLAIDPDFESNNFIYTYHTYRTLDEDIKGDKFTMRNRVTRFKLVNGSLVNASYLVNLTTLEYHTGGRLEFGPDGKLYITTGELAEPYSIGKDEESNSGTILRINSNGSIPKDNPFEDSPVFSMGHRNPQGLAWNPESGSLFSTEHGPWRYDEVNRIQSGGDYGWYRYKCGETLDGGNFSSEDDFISPTYCWKNWTMAPSGSTFVHDQESPLYGDLFVAGLRGNHIGKFEVREDRVVKRSIFYIPDGEQISMRLRDIESRNGNLYLIGGRFGAVKITPNQ